MQIVDTDLGVESEKRYLTYALSVVSGRAIPDIRDGLKPVQRRILYAMFSDLKLLPQGTFRKSAAVVGEVLAKYHPHGDLACYEAMVRMAQNFSMRYPLVQGQGNFGSLDGDNAAAYRYTEAKLEELSIDLLGEIKEDTVTFRDNFDTTAKEPEVLPSRFPNLLVNGCSGIAVGIATSIPPHNLCDVIKAAILLAKEPHSSCRALLKKLHAPDFPTKCSIHNSEEELLQVYETGKGSIRMRGDFEIVEGRKTQIVFTSIPYGVNKASIIEKIAALVNERKIPQITDLRDESTEEVRICIEITKGTEPQIVTNFLFKNTPLETNFNVNLTVLVPSAIADIPPEELASPIYREYADGDLIPRKVNLRQTLASFLSFRYRVVVDRLKAEAVKLRDKLHLLEGVLAVCLDLDEAIKIIRASNGRADCAQRLRTRFNLTEVQSLHVVDMRVYQLSKLLIAEIQAEADQIRTRLGEIEATITSGDRIRDIVTTELAALSKKYQQARLSAVNDYEEIIISDKDYLVNEDVYVIFSRDGWIRRIKNTKNVTPSQTRMRDGDEIQQIIETKTTDNLYFFTNLGYVYVAPVTVLSSGSGFGAPVSSLFKFQDLEKVIHVAIASEGELLMVAGDLIHRTWIEDLPSKKTGKRVMRIDDLDSSVSYFGKISEWVSFLATNGKEMVGGCIRSEQIPLRGLAYGVKLAIIPDGFTIVAVGTEPEIEYLEKRYKTEEIKRARKAIGLKQLK